MAEFLILPDDFVEYVTRFRRLPIPPDADAQSFRSVVEAVCLETTMSEEGSPLR